MALIAQCMFIKSYFSLIEGLERGQSHQSYLRFFKIGLHRLKEPKRGQSLQFAIGRRRFQNPHQTNFIHFLWISIKSISGQKTNLEINHIPSHTLGGNLKMGAIFQSKRSNLQIQCGNRNSSKFMQIQCHLLVVALKITKKLA